MQSEILLRDFTAMRTAATHQWYALHTELQKQKESKVSTNEEEEGSSGSPSSSPVSAASRQAKTNSSSASNSSGIPTNTLAELLHQNETMLLSVLNRERTSMARMQRQLDEEMALKVHAESKVTDLQARIETLDLQMQSLQNSKNSTDQRLNIEVHSFIRYNLHITYHKSLFYCKTFVLNIEQVSALQQRIAKLMSDLDDRQDEYSATIAGLTKSHEEHVARTSSHLASVMEQRIAEANVRVCYYGIVSFFSSTRYNF
jgi:hypothetical protein